MKVYFVSLGIGLNMFFTEFYPIGTPVEEKAWSGKLLDNYRFNRFIRQKSKEWQ